MKLTSGILAGMASAGFLVSLTVPALAVLQLAADVSGAPLFCVDNNAACDTNPAVGIIQIAPFVLNGVSVDGETVSSTGTPANPGADTLNVSNLSVTNTTNLPKSITVAVSDTDFLGPARSWHTAGSGVWQIAIGSNITLNWFDDLANVQGANTPTDTPGLLIDTFGSTAVNIVDSFSHTGAGPAFDSGPFSMTEQTIYTLTPFGELLNRGQTEVKSVIPEPSTWAMVLLGFGGLGYAALRKGRKVLTSSSEVVELD